MRQVLRAPAVAIAATVTALAVGGGPRPAAAAEIDLETTFAAAPSSAQPGETVTYTVDYTNNGTTEPADSRVRLLLPPGCFLDWTTAEIAAVEASFEDSLGNQVDVRQDPDVCDNMLVSVESSGGGAPSFPAGTTGQFSVSVPLPATIPTVGMFRVESPQAVAGLYDIARGACTDCGDPASCFGGPLSTKPAVTADLEVVSDPTPGAGQTPSMGCHALAGFTPGRIALVRRGSCGFGAKALNAQQAGAAGVVIVNDEARQSLNLHSIAMDGGSEVSQVTIPVVMIAYAQGEALIARVEAENRVIATLGGTETENLPFVATAFHTPGSPDTDPNGLNDVAAAVTHVSYLGEQAPVAAFSYSPITPVKGQEVHFVDTSTHDPTSWSWDFGDGAGTSTDQNPVYSYAVPGTYSVILTASNAFGSDSVSHDVNVAGVIQGRHDTFIAAAANAAGDNGAFFLTDLEINNRGLTPLLYQLAWLPRGADNSDPSLSEAFMLAPGRGIRYTNVLGTFGLSEALGALAVVADTGNALVMSRTYNQAGDGSGSTFGQSIPGVPLQDMIVTGERRRILFMTENEDYRSNLGCQNGTSANLHIMIALYGHDGTSLGLKSMDLAPLSNKQINRVFQDVIPPDLTLSDGYVDVWTETPNAAFFCYGSVVDNHSNDPTTVLPQ